MDARAKAIVRTLGLSLAAAAGMCASKLAYGYYSGSLAFTADGIHGIFDTGATLVGMLSVIWSSRPPDQGHPYGHRKFETFSAILLALFLLPAAYEVGSQAFQKLSGEPSFPTFNFMGIVILVAAMGLNVFVSRIEDREARRHSSHFLAADSTHNKSDFWTTGALLASIVATQMRIPYVDAGASLGIGVYLVYLSVRLLLDNIKPLLDTSVLNAGDVERVVKETDGVMYCHNVRSRGEKDYHFLDLNIHLPGSITLDRAHEITHRVEERLKEAFPGLVDVVIHTEPHDHPPCSKS